jgi:hypothetical protein
MTMGSGASEPPGLQDDPQAIAGPALLTGKSPATGIERLTRLADRLDAAEIHYRLDVVRPAAVMFCIAVPGERWEVEFRADGSVEVEVFRSDGTIGDDSTLDDLFERFTG